MENEGHFLLPWNKNLSLLFLTPPTRQEKEGVFFLLRGTPADWECRLGMNSDIQGARSGLLPALLSLDLDLGFWLLQLSLLLLGSPSCY